MNWQEVVELLRKFFAYSEIHWVYTLESCEVHALWSQVDHLFYADDEIER